MRGNRGVSKRYACDEPCRPEQMRCGERAAGQVSAIRLARPAECFRLTLAVNIQRPARTAGAEILGNIILWISPL